MIFLILTVLLAFLSLTNAKSTNGDIAITINGQIIDPKGDDSVKLTDVNPGRTILVRGQHIQFDIDTSTLALRDFILTGFPNDHRLVSKPTLIFVSKTPTFPPGALNGLVLSQVEVRADQATLLFNCAGGKYKFQIGDIATGGDLQIESEFSGPTDYDHILGPDIFFFLDPDINKILFTDGLGAVSKVADPVNYHDQLLGKDSPEAASQIFQSDTESKWTVQAGGRVGQVFGEDALEGASSNCTQQCQKQHRIQGSIPLPPNPTPTPPFRREFV